MMNIVKAAFFFILGALYASSWWAAAVFASDYGLGGLWVIPALSTIVLGLVLTVNLVNQWDDS